MDRITCICGEVVIFDAIDEDNPSLNERACAVCGRRYMPFYTREVGNHPVILDEEGDCWKKSPTQNLSTQLTYVGPGFSITGTLIIQMILRCMDLNIAPGEKIEIVDENGRVLMKTTEPEGIPGDVFVVRRMEPSE